MAKTRKSTQILNLRKYDVLIEDTATRSDYFKITQFDGYFYGGRNAFLIAGTNVLKPNSRILVEILDVNGDTIYSAPVANFIEGSSRLVQIEVYSDTPIGPGKLIILGCAQTYLNGDQIPSEWRDKFNIRWVANVTISPLVKNKTPIRFVNTPVISVEEKFYPTPATASFSQSVELPTGSYELTPIRYNIFQNGYLIKLKNPVNETIFNSEYLNGSLNTRILLSGSTEFITGSIPITKIYNSTTAESRGKLLTSSLGTVVVNAFISGSGSNYTTDIQPYGNITVSSLANLQYDKIFESPNSSSQVSFAKLRISNLNTLSGEVNKLRISYKSTTDPGDYVSLGEVLTQVEELLAVDSGSKIISLGTFNKIKIDDYWYAATMSVSKSDSTATIPGYYLSSSLSTNLSISQSSVILIDGINANVEIENNKYKDNKSYFIGTKNTNKFTLVPNSEYTLKFTATVSNVSSSLELTQDDYSLDVYVTKQENSTGKLLETNTRGQLIGTLTFEGKRGNHLFENVEFNFTPKIIVPTELGLRFIVYGGFWNISNISLKPAEEQFFNPDEVSLLIPNVNFSNKLLTFKTEYLDINNNSIPITTISNPVYFTGSAASTSITSFFTASYSLTSSYAFTSSYVSGGVIIIGNPTDGTYGGSGGNVSGLSSGDILEDAFDKLEVILGKLAPAKPANLSTRTLTTNATTYSAYTASGVTPTLRSTVTATARPTASWTFVAPTSGANSTLSYDADSGTLSATVDGVTDATSQRILTTANDAGTYGNLIINNDLDPYNGTFGQQGFWKGFVASVAPTASLPLGPHTASLTHSTTGTTSLFTWSLDNPSTPTITAITGSSTGGTTRYVSGVPTLATGETVIIVVTGSNTVSQFYNSTRIFAAVGNNSVAPSVNATLPTTPPQSASLTSASITLTIASNAYTTASTYTATAYNSAGTTATSTWTPSVSIRVDTTSNESARCRSGISWYPDISSAVSGAGALWTASANLTGSRELQMTNNIYHYPSASNYTLNYPTPGPDYRTLLPDTTSSFAGEAVRWATFSSSVNAASNVTVTFTGTSNFILVETTGSMRLYVRVSGSIPTNGWIDGSSAYSGVGNPINNGDAALVVGSSTTTTKVITFGSAIKTGVVFVRVGIPSSSLPGSTRRFSGVTITQS